MQRQKESSTITPAEKKSNKSVSFAPTAMMRLALHIDNYTDDEIKASFYGNHDYVAFKQDAKRTAKMIEMKQTIDEIKMSRRGVESLARDVWRLKSKQRRHARRAVMFNQELNQDLVESGETSQQKVGEQMIAAAYIRVTRESAAMAYLTGLLDEAAIVGYQQASKNQDADRESKAACLSRMLRTTSRGNSKNFPTQLPIRPPNHAA